MHFPQQQQENHELFHESWTWCWDESSILSLVFAKKKQTKKKHTKKKKPRCNHLWLLLLAPSSRNTGFLTLVQYTRQPLSTVVWSCWSHCLPCPVHIHCGLAQLCGVESPSPFQVLPVFLPSFVSSPQHLALSDRLGEFICLLFVVST